MTEKLDQRIAKATEKLTQLRAQKQAVEARRRARMAKADRAADTRRKVLAGAWALSHLPSEQLRAGLDAYLTRADDRALFDLAETRKQAATAAE